eukprot:4780568-Amphidinium_carterae.1
MILPGHVCGAEEGVRTESPTAPQMSPYFLLSIAVQSDWHVSSFDVANAFLSGQETARLLYVQPPKNSEHLGLTGRHLLKMRRMLLPVWSAGGEPREHSELLATFLLFEEGHAGGNQKLVGILSLHVDDGIWAGAASEQGSALTPPSKRLGTWCPNGLNSRNRRDQSCNCLVGELRSVWIGSVWIVRKHSALLSLVQQLAWPAQGSPSWHPEHRSALPRWILSDGPRAVAGS